MIVFNYNQDNLQLLSSELELETDETHTVNDFYGQAKVIRKYANYKRPIKVVYEHSLPFHNIIWEVDKKFISPVAFVSSQHRFEVYKKEKSKKFVINVGSILNYVISITDPSFAKNGFKSTNERNGSIYFPSHSTHHIKSLNNADKIIAGLLNLPEIYKPVYVCMYWKDIQYGNHIEYLKNGIKVVSAGHIYDNLFYFRLYDILKNFKYALGSSFGSYIFHASRSGCLVVFPKELQNVNEVYKISTENFNDKDFISRIENAKKIDELVINLFGERSEHYSKEQKEFIEYYCSSKILSPFKLKTILLLAEPLYFINYVIEKMKSLIKKIFFKS
jgi:hypothetical protein